MAKQTINIGSSANDGTGDPLRTAFDKINDNFSELYGGDDDATNFVIEDTSPQLGGNLDINGWNIVSARSDEDIIIAPSGAGGVVASSVRIAGTTLSSDDSSAITIAEALQLNGATNVDGALTATTTLGVTGASTLDGVTVTDNTIAANASNSDLKIDASGTGVVTMASQLTLTGSFKKAIHTFTGTDAITETEHAGRTLLLGEVGGNANVVLTLPDATGSGSVYHFIVSIAMGGSTTYKIQAPDANNTIAGQIMYLDEDGTTVTAYPTVAASDTITLNSGTQGGLVGDTVTLIDMGADKWHVTGQMRVSAGTNPATPFSAAVS
jgi:hypothetical protein